MEPSLDHARLKELGELHPSALRVAVIEARRERDAALAKIEALEAEVSETDQLFETQHRRTREADKLWQEATGQHHVLPDLGTLIQWLLDRATTAEEQVATLKKDNLSVVIAVTKFLGLLEEAIGQPIPGLNEVRNILLDRAKGGTPA